MDFKLHHFAILCENFDESLAFYQNTLGNQLTSQWHNKDLLNLAFVGIGGEGTLELVGKPHLEYEEEFISKHGYGIHHISFLVEDADRAFEELKAQGVEVAWEPQDVLFLRQCGFFDEDGLLFEVFSYPSPMPLATPNMDKSENPMDLTLHHVSILTPELRRSQKFYEEMLGLKTVFEYTEDDGGFIFLIDSSYDRETNDFMLEIIGPPYLEPREVVMLEKHGACYDHLAYTAPDVEGTWKQVIERGAKNMDAPVSDYGLQISWVNDVDGNDVEIMSPIPDEYIENVLQGGEPINTAGMF